MTFVLQKEKQEAERKEWKQVLLITKELFLRV
jgi:hypothetical protein